MIELEELKKLLAEAEKQSPLPWYTNGTSLFDDATYKLCDYLDPPEAALIVAAVNALPGLIAMARDIAKLQEPDGVLVNMLRGTVPKVPAHSLHKLYTEDELLDAARAVLRARIAATDDSTALKEKPQ